MLRKLFLGLSALLCSYAALAQYGPPPPYNSSSSAPFHAAGKTSWLAATSTSATVFLSIVTDQTNPNVQVYNSGTTVALVGCDPATFVATAGSAGTATSDYPVAPGAVIVITPPAGSVVCAAVTATAGAIYFTPGVGL